MGVNSNLHASAWDLVGDGVNDAPALARAAVRFHFGTGTDVARNVADGTFTSGGWQRVATSVVISKATMRYGRQNLAIAFLNNAHGFPEAKRLLYPFLCIPLCSLLTAAAMLVRSVTLVTNANCPRRRQTRDVRA